MAEEIKQMQDDEREALASIYEGDDAFKESNPTTYQYKVKEFIVIYTSIVGASNKIVYNSNCIVGCVTFFSMERKRLSIHSWWKLVGMKTIQTSCPISI